MVKIYFIFMLNIDGVDQFLLLHVVGGVHITKSSYFFIVLLLFLQKFFLNFDDEIFFSNQSLILILNHLLQRLYGVLSHHLKFFALFCDGVFSDLTNRIFSDLDLPHLIAHDFHSSSVESFNLLIGLTFLLLYASTMNPQIFYLSLEVIFLPLMSL